MTKKDFMITVLITVPDNPRNLIKSINSVINQTLNFKENIQIIFIDYEENKESTSLIRKYYERYPDNIIILSRDYLSQAYADNNVFKLPSAKYVTFMDGNDYYSENTFQNVKTFYKNRETLNIVTIPICNENKTYKQPELSGKYETEQIIDLEKEANNPQTYLRACFIRKSALQNITYDKNLLFKNETILINKLLLNQPLIGVTNKGKYYIKEKININNPNNNEKHQENLEKINICNQLIKLSKKQDKIPDFIAYTITYYLENIIKTIKLNFLNKKEKNTILENIKHILEYINEEIIHENNNLNHELKSFLIYQKKEEYHIKLEDNNVLMQSGEYYLDDLNKHKIWIDYIEIRDDKLDISGVFTTNFNTESIKINLLKEDIHKNVEKILCKQINYPQNDRKTKKYLGTPWKFPYSFEVTTQLTDTEHDKYTFEVEFNEENITYRNNPKIEFRISSYFSNISIYSRIKDYIVFKDSSSISVIPYSFRKLFNFELKSIFRILKSSENGKYGAVFWHLLYLVLYRFMSGKRIWLLNDRLDVVDDNAKHLYRYATGQDNGIREYFIIDKNCKNEDEIRGINKNVLKYGSFKHKLLYMFCEKRISSFLNEKFFNPFYNDKVDHRKLYNNLVTAPQYFLQHGVIYRDLTSHIKRYNHNLALIVTSAERERQSFFDLEYGFSEEVVQVLGLPRFDNLIKDNKIKKQVLFTPTWRLQLEKNESLFLSSDYYKMLSDFLNNDELFRLLEEYGYKFIFKPHPQLIKHLSSLKMNDNVIISTEDSYQELIRDSALMISDVSSVISDFAYLKKPIIYYQKNDDHHFEPFFDYANEGFGDVLKTEDEMISKLRYYLENDCQMEEKYKQRVTNFFKYNDKNNCKRVYEWILKH